MSKKSEIKTPSQYSLSLVSKAPSSDQKAKVIGFVDRTSYTIRKEATERVKASGIFQLSKGSTSK